MLDAAEDEGVVLVGELNICKDLAVADEYVSSMWRRRRLARQFQRSCWRSVACTMILLEEGISAKLGSRYVAIAGQIS